MCIRDRLMPVVSHNWIWKPATLFNIVEKIAVLHELERNARCQITVWRLMYKRVHNSCNSLAVYETSVDTLLVFHVFNLIGVRVVLIEHFDSEVLAVFCGLPDFS